MIIARHLTKMHCFYADAIHLYPPGKTMNELAIIIPAYKGEFFFPCLESISNQSNKGFTVYVFDDQSPDDLSPACKAFQEKMDIKYHRFNENLGRKNLPAHWARCLRKTAGEPWLWLFSDDDIMEKGCVQSFYEEARINGLDKSSVYRFPLDIIDSKGNILHSDGPWPKHMGTDEFIEGRLNFRLTSSINEFIFSRQSFETNGFQEFPLAWCTDDAAWASFGREGGIRTLASGRVGWRSSNLNISSDKSPETGRKKLQACTEFIKWLKENTDHQPNNTVVAKWLAMHWLMLTRKRKSLPPSYGFWYFCKNLNMNQMLMALKTASLHSLRLLMKRKK